MNTLLRPGFKAGAKGSQRPGDNSGRNPAMLLCYPSTAPSAAVPEVPFLPKATTGTAADQLSSNWPALSSFFFGANQRGERGEVTYPEN